MCDIFKEEFRLAHFGLSHNRREDFISCQWNWHPLVYVIYRILAAAYLTVFFITIVIIFSQEGNTTFMAYLTLWTYLLLTLYFLFSAIAVVFYTCCRRELRTGHQVILYTSSETQKEAIQGYNNIAFVENGVKNSELDGTSMSNGYPNETNGNAKTQNNDNDNLREEITSFMKICWVLGNTVQVFAIVVTLVYFTALFPLIGYTNFVDVNLHGVNSFLVIVDTCLSSRPVRLLHVIHPVIYGMCYLIFSAIYWSFDHVNNVLYPGVLDWNDPGTTAIWIAGLTLVGIPLLQLAHFGAYRLKLYISSRE